MPSTLGAHPLSFSPLPSPSPPLPPLSPQQSPILASPPLRSSLLPSQPSLLASLHSLLLHLRQVAQCSVEVKADSYNNIGTVPSFSINTSNLSGFNENANQFIVLESTGHSKNYYKIDPRMETWLWWSLWSYFVTSVFSSFWCQCLSCISVTQERKKGKGPTSSLPYHSRLSTSHSSYAASIPTTSTTRTVTQFTCSILIPSTTLPLTWPLCHKKLQTDLHLAKLQCGRRRITFMSGSGRSRN